MVGGSNPSQLANAALAQMVERLTCNQDVVGSKPASGTKFNKKVLYENCIFSLSKNSCDRFSY